MTRGITTQKMLFDYVIASLSLEFAMEVRDLLLKPPDDSPYDVLKAQLVKRTAASEQWKLQQLISCEELGNRKPIQLLRHMQQLLGDKLSSPESNSFLGQLFLQRLPPSVRMVLAFADTSMELGRLANMADKVMEVATPTVAAVSHKNNDSSTTHDSSEITHLREKVARLASLVESLATRPRHRSTSRPSRRSSNPAPPTAPQDVLCWYHAKFGEAAQKCKSPFLWDLNTQAGH